MIRIAITGGIGAGKTAVTEYLTSNGFDVIDADLIAHEMTCAGGSAIPYIIEKFGKEYICQDGSMDRRKMAELVYNDPESLHLLEAGTTDKVILQVETEMDKSEQNGAKVAFADIPLLFEKKEQAKFDVVWLVVADKKLRVKRLLARDDRDAEEIARIIDTQLGDAIKIRLADEVIENNRSKEALNKKLLSLLKKYKLQK